MTRKQRHRDYDHCPIEGTLDLIGGKWKGSILFTLSQQTMRFNQLRKTFPKLSQRQLTNQLREMEADNLIHREVYPQVPPKVEYSLKERGQSLLPILTAMYAWGEEHVLNVEGPVV